jgi:hypothetical protein
MYVCVCVYMYTHTHTHTHILICANHIIYSPNFLFFQYPAPQACIRIAGYCMMRKRCAVGVGVVISRALFFLLHNHILNKK